MRTRCVALLGLALALAGCVSARASRYAYFLAQGRAPAERWAVAPTSVSPVLREHLGEAAQRLESEICARVEAGGHACSRRSPETGGYDALIVPELRERDVAVLAGGWVVWDGVKRRARVVRGEGAPLGTYQPVGRTWVLSLHVRVSAPDGTRLFENQVGLDLLHEARIDASGYRKELRADPLGDREALRDSVELALGPLIGG